LWPTNLQSGPICITSYLQRVSREWHPSGRPRRTYNLLLFIWKSLPKLCCHIGCNFFHHFFVFLFQVAGGLRYFLLAQVSKIPRSKLSGGDRLTIKHLVYSYVHHFRKQVCRHDAKTFSAASVVNCLDFATTVTAFSCHLTYNMQDKRDGKFFLLGLRIIPSAGSNSPPSGLSRI